MTRKGAARKVVPQTTPTKPKSKTKEQMCRSSKFAKATPKSVYSMTSRDFQMDTNAHVEVIAEQLKDYGCISFYQSAIMHNRHLFQGRTVLDVGCGVGILSLFAAKAGAAHVYAVDTSNALDYTEQIVRDNGYADVIHVIKGSLEQIQLPVAEVDIIVCNWLGYSMLFQSACDLVIYARDKWLKKENGIILPDVAKLFMAAVEDSKHKNERVEWWNDVYGVNMKCMREFALSEPSFQLVQPQQLLSTQFGIKYLNMYTATKKDLNFRCKYMLEMRRSGHVDGIVTFFQVFFTKSHTSMGFSTDPCAMRTHWMQSVFYLDKPVHVNSGELYYGGIEMCSVGRNYDLNNMELGFEMFSGDPAQLQLEAEIRWKLKPHAAIPNEKIKAENMDNGLVQKQQLQQPKKSVSKKEKGFSKEARKGEKEEKTTCSKSPVSSTVVIGDYTYPCVVEKKGKKLKHSKKG